MIVVDSSVWIYLFRSTKNQHTAWLLSNIGSGQIAITDLILCEVLKGMASENLAATADRILVRLVLISPDPLGDALFAAFNYRLLRRRGFTIRSTADCLIATTCMRHDHLLLHRDRDFDIFERELGLKVIHP